MNDDSSAIRPIETSYRGYKFRSRTEARWAVFFDALGLEWEYEKEGYDLGEAGWYLPDFWLPQVEMWAEVKPAELNPEERAKVVELVRKTRHSCMLLIGVPDWHSYPAIEIFPEDNGREVVTDGVDYCMTRSGHDYPVTEHQFYAMCNCYDSPNSCFRCPEGFDQAVAHAVRTARSARFEHGETP